MSGDEEKIFINDNEDKTEKDKNSSTNENSNNNEDWENLLIDINKLSINVDDSNKDTLKDKEEKVSTKPKEKIRIGRGFKEQSHSVLKNDPVYTRPKSRDQSETKDNKIENEKLNPPESQLEDNKDSIKNEESKSSNDNKKGSNIDSPQTKRTYGRPGERNIAVASRMLRNALGIKSPPSEKEKQHEKRLKELREEKRKQSNIELSKSDDTTKKD